MAVMLSLPEGTMLHAGTYRIERFIGSGGFGCTYEARHVLLDKRLAIKEFFISDFCNRDSATGHVSVGTESRRAQVEKLRGKFVLEARALSRMDHKGIVRVTDVFEDNGTAYYVMDYIEGSSLRDIVRREGRLSEDRAVRYILQVCEALEYVHSHKRLHLDIKPGNIMVDDKDNAVLIDFGASKQYDYESGEGTSTLVGFSRGYAPPEQMGSDVKRFDPAIDIYALGATLYTLLTGSTPPASTLLMSGSSELKPLPAGISDGVRSAIEKAMRVDRKERPQTVAAFMAVLGSRTSASGGGEDTEIDTDDGTTDIDIASVVTVETPQPEPKPQPQPTPHTPAKNRTAVIVAAVFIVCAVGIYGISSALRKSGETSVAEEDTLEVVTSVTDAQYTNSKGVSFVYTGAVNADGAPDGRGKGVYSEGTYEGEYSNGLRHGNAVYDTNNGTNHFEGTYADDEYSEGTLTWVGSDAFFKGTFRNNSMWNGKYVDGNDVFTYKNGEMQ